jgi:hypothetical protein
VRLLHAWKRGAPGLSSLILIGRARNAAMEWQEWHARGFAGG